MRDRTAVTDIAQNALPAPAVGRPRPSRAGRRLWLAAGSFVAAFTLVFSFAGVASAFARETGSFRVVVDEPVSSISVTSEAATSVRIVGTEADVVVVEAVTHRGLIAPEHAEEVVDDQLRIDSSCGAVGPLAIAFYCSVEYTIQVPADLDVRVTEANGRVEVENVDGVIDLQTDGASIYVTDSGGPVTAHTVGGGFQGVGLSGPTLVVTTLGGGVDAAFTEAPDRVEVRTAGGGSTLLLPPGDEAYRLDTSAAGAPEVLDVRSDPSSDRAITVGTAGGGITIRYQEPG
jgi:hypothetical protein